MNFSTELFPIQEFNMFKSHTLIHTLSEYRTPPEHIHTPIYDELVASQFSNITIPKKIANQNPIRVPLFPSLPGVVKATIASLTPAPTLTTGFDPSTPYIAALVNDNGDDDDIPQLPKPNMTVSSYHVPDVLNSNSNFYSNALRVNAEEILPSQLWDANLQNDIIDSELNDVQDFNVLPQNNNNSPALSFFHNDLVNDDPFTLDISNTHSDIDLKIDGDDRVLSYTSSDLRKSLLVLTSPGPLHLRVHQLEIDSKHPYVSLYDIFIPFHRSWQSKSGNIVQQCRSFLNNALLVIRKVEEIHTPGDGSKSFLMHLISIPDAIELWNVPKFFKGYSDVQNMIIILLKKEQARFKSSNEQPNSKRQRL